jgi:hypothetical protein
MKHYTVGFKRDRQGSAVVFAPDALEAGLILIRYQVIHDASEINSIKEMGHLWVIDSGVDGEDDVPF